MFKIAAKCFGSVLVLLVAGTTLALPTDKDQKIDIEMEGKMRIDTANEIATYSKNVVVTQGTLTIQSDELTAHGSINNLKKIIAVGSPAVLRQRPKADQAIVTVKGNRIEYSIADEKVLIQGAASFEQGETMITAAQLFYDVTNSLVEAEAGDDTIKAVLPPKSSVEAPSVSDTPASAE